MPGGGRTLSHRGRSGRVRVHSREVDRGRDGRGTNSSESTSPPIRISPALSTHAWAPKRPRRSLRTLMRSSAGRPRRRSSYCATSAWGRQGLDGNRRLPTALVAHMAVFRRVPLVPRLEAGTRSTVRATVAKGRTVSETLPSSSRITARTTAARRAEVVRAKRTIARGILDRRMAEIATILALGCPGASPRSGGGLMILPDRRGSKRAGALYPAPSSTVSSL